MWFLSTGAAPRAVAGKEHAMPLLIFRCENCGEEKDPLDPQVNLFGKCTAPGPMPGVHIYEQVEIASPPDSVPHGWRSAAT